MAQRAQQISHKSVQ